jgi:hypothetical protein
MENQNRVLKYIIEGMIVALACLAIPKRSMDFIEVLLIALVASSTFVILETYIPCNRGYKIDLN